MAEPGRKRKVQQPAGLIAVQNELYFTSHSASFEQSNEQALVDKYVHISRTDESNGIVQPSL